MNMQPMLFRQLMRQAPAHANIAKIINNLAKDIPMGIR
jgi:hypothetical protein